MKAAGSEMSRSRPPLKTSTERTSMVAEASLVLSGVVEVVNVSAVENAALKLAVIAVTLGLVAFAAVMLVSVPGTAVVIPILTVVDVSKAVAVDALVPKGSS